MQLNRRGLRLNDTELIPEYIHLLRVFKLVVNTLDRFIIAIITFYNLNLLKNEYFAYGYAQVSCLLSPNCFPRSGKTTIQKVVF